MNPPQVYMLVLILKNSLKYLRELRQSGQSLGQIIDFKSLVAD